MTTFEFTILIAIGSLLAGMLGALTGLGGGVVIVPLLTLAVWRGHSLCDWSFAGLRDCDFFRSRRSVFEGRLLEHARGDVLGNCHHDWRDNRRVPCREHSDFRRLRLFSEWCCCIPLTPRTNRRKIVLTDDPPDRYATLLKFDGSYPTPTKGRSLTAFAGFRRGLG